MNIKHSIKTLLIMLTFRDSHITFDNVDRSYQNIRTSENMVKETEIKYAFPSTVPVRLLFVAF